MEEILIELQRRIDVFAIIVGDFNTSFSIWQVFKLILMDIHIMSYTKRYNTHFLMFKWNIYKI